MAPSAKGKASGLEMLLSLHRCQSVNPKGLQKVACTLEQPWLPLKYSHLWRWSFGLCGHLSCRCRRCLWGVIRKASCVIWASAVVSFPACPSCGRLFPTLVAAACSQMQSPTATLNIAISQIYDYNYKSWWTCPICFLAFCFFLNFGFYTLFLLSSFFFFAWK